MTKETANYFFRKYEKAGFRVVYGSWPDFQSKAEVDEWIERMTKALSESKEG